MNDVLELMLGEPPEIKRRDLEAEKRGAASDERAPNDD